MLVTLNTFGGETFQVRALSHWTVANVKSEIERSQGVPQIEQRLIYGTHLLKDGDILKDSGILPPAAALSFIRQMPKLYVVGGVQHFGGGGARPHSLAAPTCQYVDGMPTDS